MTDDGWKFAESLLGITAEALKQRAQYKARLETIKDESWKQGHASGKKTGGENAADRVRDIISSDRRAPVDMAWAESQVRALVKFRQEHATPDGIRDAALEEVAEMVERSGWSGQGMLVRDIRALKSKPAKPPKCTGLGDRCRYAEKHDGLCQPIVNFLGLVKPRTHDNGCALDSNHQGLCFGPSPMEAVAKASPGACGALMGTMNMQPFHCTEPKGHDGEHTHQFGFVPTTVQCEKCGKGWCQREGGHGGRCQPPIGMTRKDIAKEVQCLVHGCDRPHQHEGPHGYVRKMVRRIGRCPRCGEDAFHVEGCGMGEAEGGGAQVQPVVHDFGWALAQMRAGKRVRRAGGRGAPSYRLGSGIMALVSEDGTELHTVFSENVLATDWEVVP